MPKLSGSKRSLKLGDAQCCCLNSTVIASAANQSRGSNVNNYKVVRVTVTESSGGMARPLNRSSAAALARHVVVELAAEVSRAERPYVSLVPAVASYCF
jgi:hypothetical protein